MKGVKDSDHYNNNSVDDISLASLGQDPQSEVDTVVEYVNEAHNNNSDNLYDDVEVKEEKEEPTTEPELSTICPQCGKVYTSHKKITDQLYHYYYEINQKVVKVRLIVFVCTGTGTSTGPAKNIF